MKLQETGYGSYFRGHYRGCSAILPVWGSVTTNQPIQTLSTTPRIKSNCHFTFKTSVKDSATAWPPRMSPFDWDIQQPTAGSRFTKRQKNVPRTHHWSTATGRTICENTNRSIILRETLENRQFVYCPHQIPSQIWDKNTIILLYELCWVPFPKFLCSTELSKRNCIVAW